MQFKIKWTCDIGNATRLGEVTWEEYVGRTEMGAWDQAFWHVDILIEHKRRSCCGCLWRSDQWRGKKYQQSEEKGKENVFKWRNWWTVWNAEESKSKIETTWSHRQVSQIQSHCSRIRSPTRTGNGESDLRNSLKKSCHKVEKRNRRVADKAVVLKRKFCFISKLSDTRACLYTEQNDSVRGKNN